MTKISPKNIIHNKRTAQASKSAQATGIRREKYEIKSKLCPCIDQPSKKQLHQASKYTPKTTAHIRKTNFETEKPKENWHGYQNLKLQRVPISEKPILIPKYPKDNYPILENQFENLKPCAADMHSLAKTILTIKSALKTMPDIS